MYKLIAIDIDGTLLKNDKTISSETFTSIQNARNKGVKIVLATGRPIQGLEKYSKQLGLTTNQDYGVSCSGALIHRLGTREVLFRSTLTYEDFQLLYNFSKRLGITLNALTDSLILTPSLNLTTQIESFLSNIPMKIVDFDTLPKTTIINRIVYINENEAFINHLHNVIKKINLSYTPVSEKNGNDNLSLSKDKLSKKIHENFTVLKPSSNTLEILSKDVNKGSSISFLAEILGIKQEEVIAIGDSGNDIDMIKYAGLGIAMGNAFPEIKEASDYITYTNEEDGVAHVIDKFILGEGEKEVI
ncbi:Cof-type HAD-IIB family hydrolase [Clostridium bovifaecis]|uniref:Cof-type HAD-IIB family hydrolase n=1 Tax=Clostridium bovifaecis TaxID=2184719 RepID=A0A6I6EUU3_9CLOT|nr:Cof-type HAD-IIB family hydrolase [Clostridium bovifaecis]